MRVLPQVEDPSDLELVARLKRADSAAFDCAYARYSSRLLGFLMRLCGRREVAEDLFQDTWCRLAGAVDRLQPTTDLLGWLLTVARNAYYDFARREVRLRPFCTAGEPPSPGAVPEEASLLSQEIAVLEYALRQLPDVDREVLLLVGVEQLSNEQCAKILGLSDAALRKRLSRARARLGHEVERISELDMAPIRSVP